MITRDRSSEYARAATFGAPAALKVADRWHLLLNLRQALERWLARVHGRLRCLPSLAIGDGRRPGQRLRAYRRSEAEIAVILTRSSRESALRTWGLELRERVGIKRAAVAVARKLAVVMHTMLKTGKLFNPNPTSSRAEA